MLNAAPFVRRAGKGLKGGLRALASAASPVPAPGMASVRLGLAAGGRAMGWLRRQRRPFSRMGRLPRACAYVKSLPEESFRAVDDS